jgi:hypothetical protein
MLPFSCLGCTRLAHLVGYLGVMVRRGRGISELFFFPNLFFPFVISYRRLYLSSRMVGDERKSKQPEFFCFRGGEIVAAKGLGFDARG